MALAQRHRDTIYSKLSPITGEEALEAWLNESPVREQDEPATREFVRSEIAGLRADVHVEFSSVRTDMHAEFSSIRTELGAALSRQTNLMLILFMGVTTVLGTILGVVSVVS